ncbi:MAG: adenylate/guanylate cyclase domain-containing protein [Betaproteobacteria bacterium]|nr:adenylate/guanylate cyclase domain-containing protein [Betaproteobacteria bacterium]
MTPNDSFYDAQTIYNAEQYRQHKATSVLAIVFTDIANSTAIREQLGEIAYERIREEYDTTFSKIVEADGDGAVVKSIGDGALVVFSEPSTAVERCVQVQQKLSTHEHFKLRIGVDIGQVSVKTAHGIVKDVFGRHVNRASRIQSLAEPGHTLTSFSVFDSAVGWLKDTSIRWHNHGVTELKGFDDAVSIHEAYELSSFPQDGKAFKRPGVDGDIRFSRAAVQQYRRIKVGAEEWASLYEDLRVNPISVDQLTWTDSDDPYSDFFERLSVTVSDLRDFVPEIPSVLWVGDGSLNHATEQRALREAECEVDVAVSRQHGEEKLRKRRYFLIVVDMTEDPAASIRLLRFRKAEDLVTPVLVYGPPTTIAAYADQAKAEGSLLCTAGLISLLAAINEVMDDFLNMVPREPIGPPSRP